MGREHPAGGRLFTTLASLGTLGGQMRRDGIASASILSIYGRWKEQLAAGLTYSSRDELSGYG